jgi:hypothetical protein
VEVVLRETSVGDCKIRIQFDGMACRRPLEFAVLLVVGTFIVEERVGAGQRGPGAGEAGVDLD